MMNKEKALKMLEHLKKTNQGWCFDELGVIWTRETLSLFLLSETAYKERR